MAFSAKQLNQYQTVAEILSTARKEKGIELEKIEKSLKINKKYLLALEKGEYNKMPGDVYVKNFARTYAAFLDLDVKKVLELLKRELEISKNISSSAPELKTDYSQSRVIITPKMVRKILIFLLGLACLIYLVWQINAIFSLPSLTVISPNQDLIIKENFITVEGQTEPEVGVTINNQEILTDRDGYFSQEIDLQTGLNTIEIKAKKKRSQANVVVRQVMVEQEESTFTP